MRNDGCATYYVIEAHLDIGAGPRWTGVNLGSVLFENMTDSEKRGDRAARLRELLHPQSASSDLWQRYGIHGFEHEADARAVLDELPPKYEFRLVRRATMQVTVVL